MTKGNVGRKGFILFTRPNNSSLLREIKAETMETKDHKCAGGCSSGFTVFQEKQENG